MNEPSNWKQCAGVLVFCLTVGAAAAALWLACAVKLGKASDRQPEDGE